MTEAPADTVAANAPPPEGAPGSPPTPPAAVRSPPRRLRSLAIGVVIAAALAAFLFLVLGTGSKPDSSSGPVVGVGSVAPDFTIPALLGGAPVNLDALGKDRNRPVVLNFFASWCTPCQKETPLLAQTAKAEQAKGSTVQFVGVDVADQPSNAIPFVQQSGIIYPVGADTTLRVTSTLYGLDGQPNTFFIDASGTVVGHVIGALTRPQLDQWLHRLAGASA